MSRVLVTGGSGFVGRHAVRELLARGHEVHSISRGSRRGVALGCVEHPADVLDAGAMSRVVADVRAESLLHLAWTTEHGAFWNSAANEPWLEASKELVSRFREAGGRRVTTAGTCAEYDWTSSQLRDGDCDERLTPEVPATPYGRAKNALTRWLADQPALSSATGRLFLLYGENEDPRRLVPSLTLTLLRGGRGRTGPGSRVRDFLHVADAAGALCALLGSSVQGPVNVGAGVGVSIEIVARKIAALAGASDALDLGALQAPADDPPRLVASVRRLREEVGFRPSIDLDEGLARAVTWWRSQVRDHD